MKIAYKLLMTADISRWKEEGLKSINRQKHSNYLDQPQQKSHTTKDLICFMLSARTVINKVSK